MSHASAADGPARGHRPKKRLIARWWFWAIIVVLAVVVFCGIWIGVRGLTAKAELEKAIPLVEQVKSQVLAQHPKQAQKTLDDLKPKVEKARDLTSDPIWRAAEVVPLVGPNLTAVRQIASVSDSVVTDAVDPLMNVASTLSPASFEPVNGAIDTQAFTQAEPAIDRASAAIQAATKAVDGIDTSATIGPVTSATEKLHGLLTEVVPTLKTLKTVVPMLPKALGSDGPRNYVLAFQNNAEARSLGGTVLSVALVTVDKGHISLVKSMPAGRGTFSSYGTSVIPLPDGVQKLYGDTFGTFIANATVRPSFVSAAETVHKMWQLQFGQDVDGVVSVDPIALSYFLRATGPINLPSGDVLTSKNAVQLLLNTPYLRYPTNEAQDAFFESVAGSVFGRLMQGDLDQNAMISALTQSWQERRLLFWSAHPNEQAELAKAGLNGELPKSDATTSRVGVYFQDAVGSKLDYYLKQEVALSAGKCRSDGKQNYRVSATLTNTEPQDAAESLTPSILGTWKREHLEPGVQRMIVMVYAPPGSTITGMSVDGSPVQLIPYHDTSYPVAKAEVEFPPGASSTITVDIVAGESGQKNLEAQVTPMVHPTTTARKPLDCSTVKSG